MREIVIDTETTGLDYKTGDRIIEVGCVELKNYVPTGNTLQFYCKPDRSISEGAKNIVGLSDDFLNQQKPFEENHKELLNFLKNDTLIIHNASFDLGFINNELSILGLPHLDNPVVDTVSLAREVLNTRIANLDYLCRRFNIDLSDRSFHGALLDSQLLAAVYLELRGGKQLSMELDSKIDEENGDLQFFDILIFAAIAGFIIYRLRSVLGKRTGFQKNISEPKPQETKKQEDVQKIPSLMDNETKLEVVYKKVNNFNHREFLDGAKKAFEIIISSFNNGDKKTLKNLVSKDVYSAFEKAIDEKTNNPESQFYSLIVEGIADAKVENDTISISVNFISEQMLNNDEGSIVKNKDTWTFEKPVNSSSPIWILTQT